MQLHNFTRPYLQLVVSNPAPPPWIVHCQHCVYRASATTKGRAMRAWAAHVIACHAPQQQQMPPKGAA